MSQAEVDRQIFAAINKLENLLSKRPAGRQSAGRVGVLSRKVLADAKRRRHSTSGKAGQGIRPITLKVLSKRTNPVGRSELHALVQSQRPKGVKHKWDLGSFNIALGNLVKKQLIDKIDEHGGGFTITKKGRTYLKEMKRANPEIKRSA